MTLDEKRRIVDYFCEEQRLCSSCPINNVCDSGNNNYAEEVEKCYDKLIELGLAKLPIEETANPEPTEPKIEHDPVNHPSHYCREGAIECIDEMLILFGREAVKNFCLCNAWKYRARAMNKNGEQDLQKSDWYIKKYRELSDIG